MAERWRLHGVDFTSAPSARKPITVATGFRTRPALVVETLERLASFEAFEAWLARAGPWLAGLDFPFGLPRAAVAELGWPGDWRALVAHCRALGRPAFRAALDRHREGRPWGARYAHRATDRPAGSHSPMKLVHPPVGLMFLEGAPRLAAAGVTVAGLAAGDPRRVAVEAYPGLLARRLAAGSYKSDDRAKETPERRAHRARLVAALEGGAPGWGPPVALPRDLRAELIADASGDALDAVLALVQAAWCDARRARRWGLPQTVDPVEGWIAGARP